MLKENKFLIGLGAGTAVVSAGLIYLGLSAGSNLDELQSEIDSQQSSLSRMQRLDPYPTPESADAKKESLQEVVNKAKEVREEMLAYNPESISDIDGSEFSENLKASVARINARFPGEDALPAGFTLGFQKYANYLPVEQATGELAFQLKAMEYLFTELANSGVGEVINLHRTELSMEEKDGPEWGESSSRGRPPSRRSMGGRGGRNSSSDEGDLTEIAERLPIELTFRAPEKVLRDFLTRIGNSDEFFFETQLARVKNPAPIPSAGKAAGAAKEGGGGAPSDIVIEDAGIVIEGDDEGGAEDTPVEPTRPAESKPILLRVSGGESLDVFLQLNLLYFKEGKEFPEIK